jgi:hypothetical protein
MKLDNTLIDLERAVGSILQSYTLEDSPTREHAWMLSLPRPTQESPENRNGTNYANTIPTS